MLSSSHGRSAAARWGWAIWAALTLFGIWPALLNGQPFFFEDTSAYVRGVDAAINRLFGNSSIWTENTSTTIEATQPADRVTSNRVSLNNIESKNVLAGRSAYYGLFSFAGAITSLWLTIMLQSALSAASVVLTALNLNVVWNSRFAVLILSATLASPLPFFNSLLMPDVFAALGILASANLVCFWQRLSVVQRAFWSTILTASILFHSSHLLTAAAVLCAAVAIALRGKGARVTWIGTVALGLAVTVGLAGDLAFSLAVQRVLGAAPIRPPFLMARVIADGPGRTYISEGCNGFEVCRYGGNLTTSSDAFLWQRDPAQGGVFSVVNAETRRKLSEEQFRFSLAVVAAYPREQVLAAFQNALTQLSTFGLSEFNYYGERAREIASRLPDVVRAPLLASSAASNKMPVRLAEIVFILALAASALVLAIRYKAWFEFHVLVALGLLSNAAICGALSTPHDRYQARVIWLVPLLAALSVGGEQRRARQAARLAGNKEPKLNTTTNRTTNQS